MTRSKNHYSEEFKEQALIKVYSRGNRSIQMIADELNLSVHTPLGTSQGAEQNDLKIGLRKNACTLSMKSMDCLTRLSCLVPVILLAFLTKRRDCIKDITPYISNDISVPGNAKFLL